MTFAIGSDHAGFALKAELITYLTNQDIEVIDLGPHHDHRVDYPDYAHLVASTVINKRAQKGIVICGSGNGINMAINKHKGIRSALCWSPQIAQLAKAHNNANVLALPARFISIDQAKDILKAFLDAEFESGRHLMRVQKIDPS